MLSRFAPGKSVQSVRRHHFLPQNTAFVYIILLANVDGLRRRRWKTDNGRMNPAEKHSDTQHFLYDSDQLSDIRQSDFDPHALAKADRLQGSALGRGTTHFIDLNGLPCALRHYRRGGWAAKLLGDRYWRSDLAQTRAWREWHLLAELTTKGLPVPEPLAAHVVEHGFFYTADLITRRIPDARPLSQGLQDVSLHGSQWQAIGACVRRFHEAGVYHADLNAHNILLDKAGDVFVIDFDKGEIRTPASNWQLANLARLRRSLDKLQGQPGVFHFSESNWGQLLKGWQGEG